MRLEAHRWPYLRAVAQAQRLSEAGAVVGIDGRAVSCATDRDIGRLRINGVGAKAVKVYIGDNNFEGVDTVTITDPTASMGHHAAFPAYVIGMPVNARNAAVYLSEGGCNAGR